MSLRISVDRLESVAKFRFASVGNWIEPNFPKTETPMDTLGFLGGADVGGGFPGCS